MIFYFTGTGNSLEIASIIAEASKDNVTSMGQAYKYKRFNFSLSPEENLGFVFPTYTCSTPALVDRFLQHASFKDKEGNTFNPKYCYLVVSCGAFVGNTTRFFARELERIHNYTLNASFSVKTVGNCVYRYPPAEGEKRALLLRNARKQAHEIANGISRKVIAHKETRNPLGIIISTFSKKGDKAHSSKEFYTLPTCTSCGQCVDICPTNTISFIGHKPRWAEMGCTQCLSCLHRCPAHAIQYGKNTETRGRYVNPVLMNQE